MFLCFRFNLWRSICRKYLFGWDRRWNLQTKFDPYRIKRNCPSNWNKISFKRYEATANDENKIWKNVYENQMCECGAVVISVCLSVVIIDRRKMSNKSFCAIQLLLFFCIGVMYRVFHFVPCFGSEKQNPHVSQTLDAARCELRLGRRR